jgi:glycine cleavage system regulatory protein/predicted small secreted protein
MRTTRPLAVVAALVLGGALLAGCSATPGAGDAALDSGAGSEAAVVDGTDTSSGASAGIAPGDEDAVVEADREIVTTGSVTVVAKDPSAAAEQVAELAESAGGRVESRRQSEPEGDARPTAELTVRVPAAQTTATVDALGQVGEVRDLAIEAVDVTGTARDLDARVAALTTSVERLRTLMGDAATTADLLAAEQELTTRQAELESLQSQRAALADQVSMSTLHVTVVQAAPTEQLAPGGFLGGLQNGWNALLTTLNGLVVVLGALLPWLVVAGLVLVVVRWVLRRVRRRAQDGGAPPADDGGTAPDDDPGAPSSGRAPLVGASARD